MGYLMTMRKRTIEIVTVFICISINAGVSAQRSVSCGNSGSQQVVAVKESPRKSNFGVWGPWEYCPPCSFARGFQIKLEESRWGVGDDTALNAIRLICSDTPSTTITSLEGPWGSWGSKKMCPGTRKFSGANIKIEAATNGTSSEDHTAVNDINFKCKRQGRLQGLLSHSGLLKGKGGKWGEWYKIPRCKAGSYICGLRTQVQPRQGRGDDTALNNVDFACCTMKSS